MFPPTGDGCKIGIFIQQVEGLKESMMELRPRQGGSAEDET